MIRGTGSPLLLKDIFVDLEKTGQRIGMAAYIFVILLAECTLFNSDLLVPVILVNDELQ
jgi:hypothetical protein